MLSLSISSSSKQEQQQQYHNPITVNDIIDDDDDNDDEEEVVGLLNNNKTTTTSKNSQNNSSNSTTTTNTKVQCIRLGIIIISIVFLYNILLYYYNKGRMTNNIDTTTTPSSNNKNKNKNTKSSSNTLFQPTLTVRTLQKLHDKFIVATQNFYTILEQQYGTEYYQDIFFFETNNDNNNNNNDNNDPNINQSKYKSWGSILFESGNSKSTISKQRLIRKMKMKLIEASSSSKSKVSSNDGISTKTEETKTQFIWATGGHSATAGHGNFYNESYTAYIQYGLQSIMESINIELISKNYAMGGTAAGPEIAFCTKEIYGIDYDILVWDYGMTDGRKLWKQAMYHYRSNIYRQQQVQQQDSASIASLPLPTSQSNPIHIVFHPGGKNSGRNMLVQQMEDIGLGILISNEDDTIMNTIASNIPDTLGLSDNEINNLPEYIRNYKCGNQIENGDPYCQTDKYHLAQCPQRKYQTSWHPGWKWHAISGYLATFYMISIIEDTIQELSIELATKSAIDIYKELVLSDQKDYDTFYRNSVVPSVITDILPKDDQFNVTHFMKGPNYCHSTKLPADIRYRGILTETTSNVGFTNYDTGIGISQILSGKYDTSNNHNQILAYTEDDRQVSCPIPTNVDYKDYFYINVNSGWKSIRIPNHAEQSYYQPVVTTSTKRPLLYGYVVMCETICPWGQCPKGILSRKEMNEEQLWTIRINGINVTDMITIDTEECDILRHSNGYQFPINPKTDNNTVFIEVQITTNSTYDPKSFTRISSWIVW